MDVEDPKDELISALLSLLWDYKVTCDAYEFELESQLSRLAQENQTLLGRIRQAEAGYEQLRVSSSQSLACFHFQGQERTIEQLQSQSIGYSAQLETAKEERDRMTELAEKLILARPRDLSPKRRTHIALQWVSQKCFKPNSYPRYS
jgi:hypothetical protein